MVPPPVTGIALFILPNSSKTARLSVEVAFIKCGNYTSTRGISSIYVLQKIIMTGTIYACARL
jgi:hypothetical protein